LCEKYQCYYSLRKCKLKPNEENGRINILKILSFIKTMRKLAKMVKVRINFFSFFCDTGV
jgi:hypothetical protein